MKIKTQIQLVHVFFLLTELATVGLVSMYGVAVFQSTSCRGDHHAIVPSILVTIAGCFLLARFICIYSCSHLLFDRSLPAHSFGRWAAPFYERRGFSLLCGLLSGKLPDDQLHVADSIFRRVMGLIDVCFFIPCGLYCEFSLIGVSAQCATVTVDGSAERAFVVLGMMIPPMGIVRGIQHAIAAVLSGERQTELDDRFDGSLSAASGSAWHADYESLCNPDPAQTLCFAARLFALKWTTRIRANKTTDQRFRAGLTIALSLKMRDVIAGSAGNCSGGNTISSSVPLAARRRHSVSVQMQAQELVRFRQAPSRTQRLEPSRTIDSAGCAANVSPRRARFEVLQARQMLP